MQFYVVTGDGSSPDHNMIKELLSMIPDEYGSDQTHTYRSGPIINDPRSIIKLMGSSQNYSFLFVRQDNSCVIFNQEENKLIIEDLKNPEWEGHLTGEVVEAYITTIQKEEESC